MNKANIGIVGGTGYSGVELMRILAGHPQVHMQAITSRGSAGQRVDELFPSLRGQTDLVYAAPDDTSLVDCDLVFFATPNGVAMNSVPARLPSLL